MQTKPLSFRFIPWLPWTWKYNIQPTILVGSYIKHRKIMWTCSPRLLILVFERECRVSEWSLDSQWVLGSWASAMESGFLFWKNLHRTQGIPRFSTSGSFVSLHGTFRSFCAVHFLLISPVNDIVWPILCFDYVLALYIQPPILSTLYIRWSLSYISV